MSINIAKANQGEFYPFSQTIKANENILSGLLAEFDGDIEIQGTFVVDKDNVYVDSELNYSIIFKCDRCLADVKKDFCVRCMASFYLEGEEVQEGFYPYNNNVVDMTIPAEQEIILNLPTRVLCKPDCKGLCNICGTNLNEKSCDCDKLRTSENITPNNPFGVLKNLK